MQRRIVSSGSSPTTQGDTGLSKWQILALVGLGVSVTAVGVGIVWYIRRKSTTPPSPRPVEVNGSSSSPTNTESNNETENPTPTDENTPPLSETDQALEVKAKGNELFKQKKFQDAISLYEEALSLCPSDQTQHVAALHHNIAACLENMVSSIEGKDEKDEILKKVVTRCTTAIQLKPRYIKALIKRNKAFDALDRPRDALLDIVRVLVLDEEQSPHFQAVMPKLLKSIGKQLAEENYKNMKPLEPPTQLIRAYFSTFCWQDDLSKGRLLELWNKDHDESTDEDEFNNEPFVKAASSFRNNMFSDVISLLTQAIDSGSDVFKPHAYLLRGTFYCLWRRDHDAMNDLQRVIDSGDIPAEMIADAHIKKAAIFAGLCQLEECHAEFDKASGIKPDHPDIYVQRARVYLESEDPNMLMKAPDDLDIALKLAPSNPHTRYCYGAVFHRGGLLSGSMHLIQGAKTHFEEAYSKFPDCVEGIILYSLYLQDAQEVQKCEELLGRAIQLEPDNASAHFSLSLLYLLVQQDIDKAIKSLETAIAMDSSCIQAYEALASLEMQRNNKERAHQLYRDAIDNSRSMMELQQAYTAYEVFATQNQVCEEYGINPLDLMQSRLAAANKGVFN